MQCPKCTATMSKLTHGDIEVDRCTGCRGIWFDLLEREKLVHLQGSERIDIGNPDQGAVWNQIDRIDCPVCGTRMIAMVDAEQPHVWFEACKSCNGVFLDAGEFKDLKERTLLDRLRDLFGGRRD